MPVAEQVTRIKRPARLEHLAELLLVPMAQQAEDLVEAEAAVVLP